MVRLILIIFMFAVTLASPTVADAQEGILMDPEKKLVVVWMSEYAMKEGLVLLEAGQTDLALKKAACVVDQKTRAVRVPGGYSSHRVVVIEGKFKGCEGNVKEFYGK